MALQAANIDYTKTAPDEAAFVDKHPFAAERLLHFENEDRKSAAAHTGKHATSEELRAQLVVAREKVMNETNLAAKLKLQAKYDTLTEQHENFVRSHVFYSEFADDLKKYMWANRNVPHVDVDPAEYDDGRSVADCKKTVRDLADEVQRVENIDRTAEEAKRDFTNGYWRRLQRQGEILFDQLLAGGVHDSHGRFIPRTSAEVMLPSMPEPATFELKTDLDKPVHGAAHTHVTASLQIIAWLDDGAMLGRFHKKIDEYAASRIGGTISMEEKAAKLAALNGKLLHVRRTLEAACMREEKEGKQVQRLGDTPAPILLWVERAAVKTNGHARGDTITIQASVKPGKASGTLKDLTGAAEFEGADK